VRTSSARRPSGRFGAAPRKPAAKRSCRAAALGAACLWAVVLLAAAAWAGPSQDRGWLNLAWDAHEAGLFEEALSYLGEVGPGSELGAEAVWLRAECLYDLGRFQEAARVLEGPTAEAVEDRQAFLRDVYWDWAWAELTAARYEGAVAVAERMARALPDDPYAEVLSGAARFRRVLATALAGEPSEVQVRWMAAGKAAPGPDWVRAYPWDPAVPWVPEVTWDEWLPSDRLAPAGEGNVAWVRVPADPFLRALEKALAEAGLEVRPEQGGFWASDRGETVFVNSEEWRFRAATEALGPSAAAALAAVRAVEALEAQADLVSWVRAHAGGLEVRRQGHGVRLRHPETGRRFDLDPDAWAGWFASDPDAWEEFWTDLRAELARPVRPFRCFCGRKVVLREVPVRTPGEALVWERAGGVPVVVAALCPDHVQYLTAGLLKEWGVGLKEVAERVRRDAREAEWALSFARDGEGAVLLEGEGAAALARRPELLLGALEAVEGQRVRNREVRVVAPTPRTVVVLPSGVGPPELDQAVRWGLRWGGSGADRIDLRTRVRLPSRPEGRFRVSPAP